LSKQFANRLALEVRMRHVIALFLAVTAVAGLAPRAMAQATLTETTLEKVARTGVLVIGTRTSSPPFAYIARKNEWVGFSIDLVEQGVLPAVAKKVGKRVRLEKKESTPATRIPLLVARRVDLVAETMTDAPDREGDVDFSLTFFLTGGQFLVKQGSPIKGIDDIAGKHIGVLHRSTYARIIREQVPKARLVEFPDQPGAFNALVHGKIDAYTNDGVQLHGLKRKLPELKTFEVVGRPYTREPYAMALRKGDNAFREVVDAGLRNLFESGKYFEIYDKWFGPASDTPYPLSPEAKEYLLAQLKK
jgi:polar amino acid transport system substrate-binding protein